MGQLSSGGQGSLVEGRFDLRPECEGQSPGQGRAEPPGALEPSCRVRGPAQEEARPAEPAPGQTSPAGPSAGSRDCRGQVAALASLSPLPVGKWDDSGSLEASVSPQEPTVGEREVLSVLLAERACPHTPTGQRPLAPPRLLAGRRAALLGSHHWPSWLGLSHPLGALGAAAAPGPPLLCKVSFTLKCWEENLQFLPRRCAFLGPSQGGQCLK